MRFTIIEEVDVILVRNGVYRQTKMYSREEKGERFVYASYGSGYVRLYRNSTTSTPKIRWDETDLKEKYNTNGRMIL